MDELIHIMSVNLSDHKFMTTDGEIGELTNFFDEFGNDTEDPVELKLWLALFPAEVGYHFAWIPLNNPPITQTLYINAKEPANV